MCGDGYDARMRTTVTLDDDDVVAALRNAMRERGVSFKEALNSAIRSGLSAANPSARPYRVEPSLPRSDPGLTSQRSTNCWRAVRTRRSSGT